jgi:hypothetical protein
MSVSVPTGENAGAELSRRPLRAGFLTSAAKRGASIFKTMDVSQLAFGESDNFLERFKGYGWYLDDLVVTTPVNHLTNAPRKAQCLDAQRSLADRIAAYRPEAIVSVLIVIKPFVDAAAIMAGSNAHRYAVPFPGMGQQGRFQAAMARIITKLPRLTDQRARGA